MKGQALITDAAPLVHEFIMRQRLAKLGYQSDYSQLTALKAECFYLIDCEIEQTQAREAKHGK